MKNYLTIIALCAVSISAFAQMNNRPGGKGYTSIKAGDLARHLHVIASDSMEGRETSMPGQKRAARYIADHFKLLGLKPVGDNGTFFQHFDVILTAVDPAGSFLTIDNTKHAWGDEYFTTSQVESTFTSNAVFLGYADSRIDASYNDRISGRIAISLLGTREQLSDTSARARMMRMFTLRRDDGIFGQLIIADADGPQSFGFLSERFAGMMRGNMSRADVPPSGRRRGQSGVRAYISSSIGEALLSRVGASLSDIRERAARDSVFTPVFLDDVTITIANAVSKEVRQTENVLGYLEGSDPKLKEEIVALTAHYDHDGIRSDGTIFYGADDDGSGTVTILELAEAFTLNEEAPSRSMLFMTVSGEEKGLLGSGFYADHPVFPLEKTTANLNIDMIGRIGSAYMPANDSMYVYVIGSDKISTDLDRLLRQANDETVKLKLDYTYNDNNDPNRFYYRSDHYNFAKNGVPVVFFFTGTHPDYHRPTDTPDKILYERMALIGRLVYSTAWKVATLPEGLAKDVSLSK